jgi:hypothetical protein
MLAILIQGMHSKEGIQTKLTTLSWLVTCSLPKLYPPLCRLSHHQKLLTSYIGKTSQGPLLESPAFNSKEIDSTGVTG